MHATAERDFDTLADESPRPVKTHLPAELRTVDSSGPLSNVLGLFSIGLGAWELLAPRDLGGRTATPYPGLLRAYGLREIAAGVGILTSKKPAGWLWARVAGDGLDLATLAAAYRRAAPDDRPKVLQAIAAVAGVTVLDVIAAGTHTADD